MHVPTAIPEYSIAVLPPSCVMVKGALVARSLAARHQA
jgi:hypothetical protein